MASGLTYVSLAELQAVKLPWGLGIERDRPFRPTLLREIAAGARP